MEVKVAKLSTGQIVQLLEHEKEVRFSPGRFSLVTAALSTNPRKFDPYWVPSTLVVWILNFSCS